MHFKMRIGAVCLAALLFSSCGVPLFPADGTGIKDSGVMDSAEAPPGIPQPQPITGQNRSLPDGIYNHYPDVQIFDPSYNYQKSLPRPQISAAPQLCDAVRAFLDGPETFYETHDAQALFEMGMGRHVLMQGWFTGLDMLHIQKPQPQPVLGEYRLGDPLEALEKTYGAPHFTDEETRLTGYRFPGFYFFAQGETVSEQITIVKTQDIPPEQHTLLDAFREQADDPDFSMEDFTSQIVKENPECFYQDLWYGFGGWAVFSSGIAFLGNGYRLVEVWGNYEGGIYFDKPGFEYRLHEADFYFDLVRMYYRQWQAYLTREGIDSPDGAYTALPCNAGRPVEGDWIYLRRNDGTAPDGIIATSHSQNDLQWLDNRYLLYDVYMNFPEIYDLQTGEKHVLNPMENDGRKRGVAGADFSMLPDGRLLWYDEYGYQYLLTLSFDTDGNAQFDWEEITARERDRLFETAL